MRPTSVLFAVLLSAALAAADEAPARFIVSDGDTLWFAPPVEVLGTRVPAAMPGPLRDVHWRDRADLERSPARSVAENLALIPGVEVSQRQQYGVQADLAIRGSTFEQVEVLLDGFDVGDSQTGHHNLDLPVGRGEIARLEVLPGHGSALYGANAFGGVVNVVTRVPGHAPGGELEVLWGEYGTAGVRAALETGAVGLLGGEIRTRVAVESFETDGQHPDTDAEVRAASLRSRSEGELGLVDVLAGFSRREFGARDFYAPFPSEERTDAVFVAGRVVKAVSDRVILEPRLSYRRHEDLFTLDRRDPDRYVNEHVGERVNADLRASVDAGYGLGFVFGAEGMDETLDSTGLRNGVSGPALGDRERRRLSGVGEVSGRHARLDWSLGGRIDKWKDGDDHGASSAALAWRVSPEMTLRGGAGTIYRMPTFTELHYEDPVNRGNPDLEPETGWTWDLGAEARRGPWRFTGSIFARFEDDLIDWVRPDADSAWETRNLADGETRGWSMAAAAVHPRGHRLGVHLTGLHKTYDLPAGWEGKYVALVPRRQIAAELSLALPAGFRITPVLRFRDRSDGVDHTVVDLRVAWDDGRAWGWRLDWTNVADAVYTEVPGVPMPGSMVTSSLRCSF